MGYIAGKLTPDMVTKKYREENAGNPMFGHCYHSSQALYYLMDTDRLEQMSAIDYHDCSHWWLRDKITNEIFDITAEQYYSVNQEILLSWQEEELVRMEAATTPKDTGSNGQGSRVTSD